MKKYNICIVGATGLVGSCFMKILEKSNLPINNLFIFASKKSQGKLLKFRDKSLPVNCIDDGICKGADYVIFMTNHFVSMKYSRLALLAGATIIDNSIAFRQRKDVPLIVPPVNAELLKGKKIISNPNCVVAICSIPLFNIKKHCRITRINLVTFQSVSGSGKDGIRELEITRQGLNKSFYKSNISNTCIPEIGNIQENYYTEEENKIAYEMRKILDDYEIDISVSCVRVPVKKSHLACVQLTTENDVPLEVIEEIFKGAKGMKYIPCNADIPYPDQDTASNKNDVFVGRLRKDNSLKNTVLFFVSGDNLMRGSALNAFEIMEECINYNDSI